MGGHGVGAAAAEDQQSHWSRCRRLDGGGQEVPGALRRVPVLGPGPAAICTARGDLHHPWGPSALLWGDDGSRYCSSWSSCYRVRSLSPALGLNGEVSTEQELVCTGKLELFWGR